jgi:hypothetical protein
MSYNYQIGQVISFDVYPAAILGNSFEYVTVLAIMDQSTANGIIDTVGNHIKMYPYLKPQGTPNDASQYNYIKVRTQSGAITALGMPWINESTIKVWTSQTITAVITGVTASDIPAVQNALISNGFPNISVTVSAMPGS